MNAVARLIVVAVGKKWYKNTMVNVLLKGIEKYQTYSGQLPESDTEQVLRYLKILENNTQNEIKLVCNPKVHPLLRGAIEKHRPGFSIESLPSGLKVSRDPEQLTDPQKFGEMLYAFCMQHPTLGHIASLITEEDWELMKKSILRLKKSEGARLRKELSSREVEQIHVGQAGECVMQVMLRELVQHLNVHEDIEVELLQGHKGEDIRFNEMHVLRPTFENSYNFQLFKKGYIGESAEIDSIVIINDERMHLFDACTSPRVARNKVKYRDPQHLPCVKRGLQCNGMDIRKHHFVFTNVPVPHPVQKKGVCQLIYVPLRSSLVLPLAVRTEAALEAGGDYSNFRERLTKGLKVR